MVVEAPNAPRASGRDHLAALSDCVTALVGCHLALRDSIAALTALVASESSPGPGRAAAAPGVPSLPAPEAALEVGGGPQNRPLKRNYDYFAELEAAMEKLTRRP